MYYERIRRVLDGYFCATLDSATLNHSAASFCGNTSTKTVCTGAVTRVWLVSSFWHICTIVPNFPLFYKPRLEICPSTFFNI